MLLVQLLSCNASAPADARSRTFADIINVDVGVVGRGCSAVGDAHRTCAMRKLRCEVYSCEEILEKWRLELDDLACFASWSS